MKNTTIALSVCLLEYIGAAAAQTKQSGVGLCNQKPEVQQMAEVGDRAGHMIGLVKQPCTWTTPMEMAGLKAKSYIIYVMTDAVGKGPLNSQDRGYVVISMDNGDQAFVRFQGKGTVTMDGGPGTGEGTWTYTGGTGKLKGLTGKGTYKSATDKDHVEEDHVEGEWSIVEAKKK
jgi:hypothetical protein